MPKTNCFTGSIRKRAIASTDQSYPNFAIITSTSWRIRAKNPKEDVFYGVTPGFACYVYMAGGDNGIYPGTASLTVYDYTTGELLGEASFKIK